MVYDFEIDPSEEEKIRKLLKIVSWGEQLSTIWKLGHAPKHENPHTRITEIHLHKFLSRYKTFKIKQEDIKKKRNTYENFYQIWTKISKKLQ